MRPSPPAPDPSRRQAHGRRPRTVLAWLPLLLVTAWLLVRCSRTEDQGLSDDLRRARAEAAAAQRDPSWSAAAELLAPLVAREDARVDDLVRAAIADLGLERTESAAALVERANRLAPQDPAVANLRGHLFRRTLDFEQAAACYRQVLAADPADLASRFLLGETLDYLGEAAGAEEQFRAVHAAAATSDRALLRMSAFKLFRMLLMSGREEEALAFRGEYDAMKDVDSLNPIQLETRGYGRLRPPAHEPVPGGPPAAAQWPAFRDGATVDLHGAEHLAAADLDGDGRLDLCGWGTAGLALALQTADGRFETQVVHERPVLDAAVGDLDPADPTREHGQQALEIVAVERAAGDNEGAGEGPGAGPGGSFLIYGRTEATGRWELAGPDGLQAGGARAAILADFDHEGDLDLVLAGEHGLALLRNDGALRTLPGAFPEATPDAARALGPCLAVLAEDFDGDNDVDFLVVTARGLALLSNLRLGAFADVTAAAAVPQAGFGAGAGAGTGADPLDRVAALDLDEDGWPDLALPAAGDGGLAWARNEHGRFAAPVALDGDGGSLAHRAFTDLDLDGHVDLLGSSGAAIAARPGPLTARTSPATLAALAGTAAGAFVPADMDGDGDLDLVVLQSGVARVLDDAGPLRGRSLPLVLSGHKANTWGVGAIVELTAGPVYRRIYWRGGPLPIGLGNRAAADVLRVTWTDGIVGADVDLPAGPRVTMLQPDGAGGSCPFLYSWNGSTFVLVTDVLGTTPLGLPYAPGLYVPFNHREDVKVSGHQLRERDGRLELALTEELREVTYLDEAALAVIDHPAATEIEPNERFTFPPFPEPHVHTLTDVHAPPRVVASNGQDVTALLAAVDDRHAQPFVKAPPQFKGLAEPWWLEITLAQTPEQRAALASAPRIRLAATGWFQWSDASVNMAAANHPHWRFEPPSILVPDGRGGWRPTGPPIGFPAGKTKTMVVDVTDLVDRADPRLRLATTLQLSWDAIRIALDDDDAPFRETRLPPTSADLAFRGFSAPTTVPGGEFPERFDWDVLSAAPRWNQHPGRYTRYGDVRPLLGAPDDMYVILGAGDCVRLAFDASALPPLPDGWTRDYLLHLDGWAKDRDPNTNACEGVEPLPFHAMSAYPPPPGERFPDDEAHRRWQEQWNTREGAVLITPLARR